MITRDEFTAARAQWESASKAANRLHSPATLRAERDAWRQFCGLRAAWSAEFAKSRGWRVSTRRAITLPQLVRGAWGRADYQCHYPEIDHPEFFVTDKRGWASKPAAILSHSYSTFARCQQFAELHGLKAELLDYSTYFPGNAIAVLYTRKEQE